MSLESISEGFTLSPDHSTTRIVTREPPVIGEPPNATFKTVLFLPEGEGRQGEGGLRTQGYFKHSLPNKPLVTVITVVFNGEKHLEETILSVINQTYDNVEYIIIDGGSTDGTLDIIREYEHVLDYWISEKDRGIYDAMNKGIDLATGDWINFMNGGDLFFSYSILESFSIEKFTYSIIYGNTLFKYDKENEVIKMPPMPLNFKYGLPFCHQSVFVKSYLHKKMKFSTNYKIYSDFDLFANLFKSNNFLHYDIVIASVTYDGISSLKKLNQFKELYSIGKKHYRTKFAVILIFDIMIRKLIKQILPKRITRKMQLNKKQ